MKKFILHNHIFREYGILTHFTVYYSEDWIWNHTVGKFEIERCLWRWYDFTKYMINKEHMTLSDDLRVHPRLSSLGWLLVQISTIVPLRVKIFKNREKSQKKSYGNFHKMKDFFLRYKDFTQTNLEMTAGMIEFRIYTIHFWLNNLLNGLTNI